MAKLIVAYIHMIYTGHIWQTKCTFVSAGFHFLISDLNISRSSRFLSSSDTIFHTLDAKYRKEFKLKWLVLVGPTEKSTFDHMV